jgi:hypothetical protein
VRVGNRCCGSSDDVEVEWKGRGRASDYEAAAAEVGGRWLSRTMSWYASCPELPELNPPPASEPTHLPQKPRNKQIQLQLRRAEQ